MRHRIWQEPGDTTIKITCYADESEETFAAANRSLLGEGHINPSATVLDTYDVASVLPKQTRFLDDCQLVGGVVVINRDKAEARVMRDVRAARDKALAESDVLLLKAQESGKGAAEATAARQALRDLPATIDLSSLTLDELAAYTVPL